MLETERGSQSSHHPDDVSGGRLYSLTESLDLTADPTGTTRHMCEIWIFSICGAILIGLSGIFPLLVIPLESGPALKQGEAAKKLRLMLSFAVGSLLGDVFLHLLPEVWAQMDQDNQKSHLKIGLWVISGLLTFMVIEKLMGDESEFEHKTSHPLVPFVSHDNIEGFVNADIEWLKLGCQASMQLQDTCDEVGIEKTQKSEQSLSKKPTLICKTNNNNHRLSNSKQRKRNKSKPLHSDTVVSTAKLKFSKQLRNGLDKGLTSDKPPRPDRDSSVKVSGYLNLMANVVDNFTHGLAVSASFCVSTKVGLVTTLAILLHEIPHEVGDFAILLRSGFDRWRAAKAQFLTALGGVVGAVTTLTAESAQIAGEKTVWILPFTSGGFMYIALVTVVPDLLQEKHGWESLKQVVCVCFGVLSMIFVTVAFD